MEKEICKKPKCYKKANYQGWCKKHQNTMNKKKIMYLEEIEANDKQKKKETINRISKL